MALFWRNLPENFDPCAFYAQEKFDMPGMRDRLLPMQTITKKVAKKVAEEEIVEAVETTEAAVAEVTETAAVEETEAADA